MKKFDDMKYKVVKKAVDKNIASMFTDYIFLKQHVAAKLFQDGFIPSYEKTWGVWTDPQAPLSYSCYSDIFAETLLLNLHPLIEKKTNKKLLPTYSYVRIYKKGDVLKKHKDRESCEVSATLNLYGSKWPIYFKDKEQKIKKVILNEGDLAIYKGCELEHWRDELQQDFCVQVFLHYTNPNNKHLEFDERGFPGLPEGYTRPDLKKHMLDQNNVFKK